MFEKLLVPLDGSRLAEASLPFASALSQALGASVTLVHIIERNPPQSIHGEHHLSREEEAVAYLTQVASQKFPPEVQVGQHVHTEETRDTARAIAEHASELSQDLIILCSHGEGGLRDRFVGSIAQQVIGHGRTPILLLPPTVKENFIPGCLMVALDGNPQHDEPVMAAAGELARRLGAVLHLLTVIPTADKLTGGNAAVGRLLPGATSVLLDMSEDAMVDYLKKLAKPWAVQGIKTRVEVRRGEPVQEILAATVESCVDWMVLGTHGRAGMGAFWSGSVAARVEDAAHLPLLLVAAKKG